MKVESESNQGASTVFWWMLVRGQRVNRLFCLLFDTVPKHPQIIMAAKGITSPWQECKFHHFHLSQMPNYSLTFTACTIRRAPVKCLPSIICKHSVIQGWNAWEQQQKLQTKVFAIKAPLPGGMGQDLLALLLPQILFPISFPHMRQHNSLCQQVDNVFRGTDLHSAFITRSWKIWHITICPQTQSYWSSCE